MIVQKHTIQKIKGTLHLKSGFRHSKYRGLFHRVILLLRTVNKQAPQKSICVSAKNAIILFSCNSRIGIVRWNTASSNVIRLSGLLVFYLTGDRRMIHIDFQELICWETRKYNLNQIAWLCISFLVCAMKWFSVSSLSSSFSLSFFRFDAALAGVKMSREWEQFSASRIS